ncbi:FUSC family protein [Adhaeribacter aquaticus]|uniref:FUSC family protein n=1 Tax=Adhaeribacter aquaticus TaxID=299567 RepID=UPI0003F681F6|nr:FUSC family protein [Adhaeribacter aquaticus]
MPNLSFNQKIVSVSINQNAFFSALAVVLGLSLIHLTGQATLAGFLVVAIQSVSGINAKTTLLKRSGMVLQGALILIATTTLAVLTRTNLLFTLVGAVLLAFSFAYWRQLFPKNWPDIVIPAGVLYFMALTDHRLLEPIIATATGGALGLVLDFILGLLLVTYKPIPLEGTEEITTASKLWLPQSLVIYAIELGLLLVIGLTIDHYAGYPHGYWMPFTAIVVLQVSHTQTLKKVGERLLGTLAGCIAGSFILFLHPSPLVQILLSGVLVFLFLYFVRKNYAVAVIFITMFVLLLLGSHAANPYAIALERVVFTIIGGLLAVLSSFVFLSKKQLT